MREPAIERRVHAGRGVVSLDDGEPVAGWPEVAYESIRALNHLTSGAEPMPAPTLYRVLGELKMVGHMLPQAFEQMAGALERSLQVFAVYDHAREPAASVSEACMLLEEAAQAASRMGQILEQAQSAIAQQGYRTPQSPPETVSSRVRRPTVLGANWPAPAHPPAPRV